MRFSGGGGAGLYPFPSAALSRDRVSGVRLAWDGPRSAAEVNACSHGRWANYRSRPGSDIRVRSDRSFVRRRDQPRLVIPRETRHERLEVHRHVQRRLVDRQVFVAGHDRPSKNCAVGGYRPQTPEKGPKRPKRRSLNVTAFCAPPPSRPTPTVPTPASVAPAQRRSHRRGAQPRHTTY